MFGIGGARPVSGGGGVGGESATPILLGVAYIQRDSDLAHSLPYSLYLEGCSYKVTSGEVGSLDSATGRVTLPVGCKIVKQTFHEAASGLSGNRAVNVRTQTFEPSGAGIGNLGQNDTNGLHGVSTIDVENDDWFEPIFVYLASAVLEGNAYGAKHIGVLEFYA